MSSVLILMGSDHDLPRMQEAADALDRLGVSWEMHIASAHRTPDRVSALVSSAEERGVRVIIAGAGMAAHLAGFAAAQTVLPVIAVPLGGSLGGLDALLAEVQMPRGIPVATVAVNGTANAGILAAEILALAYSALAARLRDHRQALRHEVEDKDARLAELGPRAYLGAAHT